MIKVRNYLHTMLSLQLLVTSGMLAHSLMGTIAKAENSGGGRPGSSGTSGVQLDLSSTAASISGSTLGKNDVPIVTGGKTVLVGANSALTPAQYLAAMSVINGGLQTLTINSAGQATGGLFQVPTSTNLTSINVPKGVIGVYDVAGNHALNLSGNFTNYGNFYLLSTNHSVSSGSLTAQNIVNNQGALISSVLPSLITSIFGLVNNLSFSLNAVQNLHNFGSITSAGSLNLTAGNQIVNGLASVTSSAALASVTATNNISLIAPNITNIGQITSALNNINIQTTNMQNAGLLQSIKGDINISNLIDRTMNINNVGGMISAHNNLNFSSDTSRAVLSVVGGNLQANAINFDNPQGTVSVSVDDISRNLNFDARRVTLSVSKGSSGLDLRGLDNSRSVALTYTGSGDIFTSGFTTRGKDVSIDTTGSISIDGQILTSRKNKGDGGNVFLSAGQDLLVGDISTAGKQGGDGGNITLIAGGTVGASQLVASGGASGNPGVITIESGKSGSGDTTVSGILDNGVAGGGVVSITSPGGITAGTISAINGTVTINSQTTKIDKIDVGNDGQLSLNPSKDSTGPYIVDLGDLSHFGTGNISIGGGAGGPLSTDIVVTGNCDHCLGNVTSISLNTQGSYKATGTSLVLDEGQSYSVSADLGVFTGSVSGGSSISFTSKGVVTVDGTISNPHVELSGSGFDISSPIHAEGGTVSLLPTSSSTVINGSQLSNVNTSTLNIGNGSSGSVQITGTADLTHVTDHVGVNLSGDFNAANATMNLANNASMVINANNVDTGAVNGGVAYVVNARGSLDVSGNLNIPNGPVVLNGDLNASGASINLHSGTSITAAAVSVMSPMGAISSGSQIKSLNAEIAFDAGSSLTFLDAASIKAATNVNLSSGANMTFGSQSGSGVLVSAGYLSSSVDPFHQTGTVSDSMLGTGGNININTFKNGSASGDVSLGNQVSLVAAGSGNTGNVAVLSGGNINVGAAKLASVGGNLWLSSKTNVNISGANIVSIASSSSKAGTAYTGGQIAILAGAPETDMGVMLAGLAANRNSSKQYHSDTSLSGNTISLQNGSSFSVVQPADHLVTLTNNNITLNGGVVFIDPPPSSTVNVTGSTINAVGPGISSPTVLLGGTTVVNTGGNSGGTPVVVPPTSTGGDTTGIGSGTGTGTGGLGTGLGGTGTILNTFSASFVQGPGSSTVNSNDISSKSTSNQIQFFGGNFNTNGTSTALGVDTLEEGPIKPTMRSGVFCSKPQLLKTSDILDEDSWIIASSSCQPFTFEEHDGSLIVGTGPAKFAPAQDRTLLLREGKILVITVDKIHVVRTPFCNITIPVNTASIVEVDTQGMVRIAQLAGGKTSVTICRNDETLILSASPGEQLVLGESAVSEEQFGNFSFPEVAHTKVSAWNLEISGLRGQKMRFDRHEMAQREPLLHCSMGCVNQTQLRRIEQLMQSMSSEQAVLKSMVKQGKGARLIEGSLPASPNQMRPISFTDNTLHGALNFNTLNAGSALVKYSGKCKVSLSSPGLIVLEEGEALVAADKRTIVKSGVSHIELKPGTVATFHAHDGLLTVRNVFEKNSTSVVATVAAKKVVGLQVGHEIIIGPKGLSIGHTLSDEPIGRRRIKNEDLSSGHTYISSEISLNSLMLNSNILAQLIRSDDDADKELARKIMKMAVCLSLVTSGHGNFSMGH